MELKLVGVAGVDGVPLAVRATTGVDAVLDGELNAVDVADVDGPFNRLSRSKSFIRCETFVSTPSAIRDTGFLVLKLRTAAGRDARMEATKID